MEAPREQAGDAGLVVGPRPGKARNLYRSQVREQLNLVWAVRSQPMGAWLGPSPLGSQPLVSRKGLRGCRRAWRVGAGESLASPVSDRASLSETGTRAVCALLGEGLEPRRTWSSFELCVVFSNQSAKICPESSDTKSPSNPARGYRGTRFVTVGFRLPGSFMMHQIS